MKAKQLLAIPALLVAVLCMATTCKGKAPADIYYLISMTNKSSAKIECKYSKINEAQRSEILSPTQRELITTIGFDAGDPTTEVSVNFKLSNASAGQFIDTTLTFKHIVLESTVMEIEMTLNEDLSLTVTEKPL